MTRRRRRPRPAALPRRTGARHACPPGVNLFDAASWNGVADRLDLRRPRHVQEVQGAHRRGRHADRSVDLRAFSPDELQDGWRLACRARATERPRGRRAAAAHAPEGRDRRRRPPGDPAPERAEALPRDGGADARGSGLRPRARPRARSTTSSCASRSTSAHAGRSSARERLQGHRRRLDDELIGVEPGDTTARSSASRSTSARRRSSRRCSTSAPARRSRCASMLNKQQPFGADVITRISATMLDPDALGRLRDLAQETLASSSPRSARRAASRPRTSTRSRSPATRR